MDLATTKAYALPGNLTAGIQHGSWSLPLDPPKPSRASFVNSNQRDLHADLKYSKKDIEHVEEWVKRHVETTWHSLGTCSMAPKEGNSIVKHGVLDERLNVHGVKNLKVADLSICPDNVGCNTYSTALLIGEKAAMLVAEDLGYSGKDLEMKVPNYHAPGELSGIASSRL
jgi:alcohol oxidase